MKNRILPLFMALIMCLGLFAGCQSSELKPYSDVETEPPAETSETTVKDYTPVFESYDPDLVVVTINGKDVTWREFFNWLHYDVTTIEYYIGEITDWDAITEFDETLSYREFIKSDALEIAKYYRVIESKCAELGIALNDEDLAAIDENWQARIDSYGSDEAFKESLESTFMSEELLRYFDEMSAMLYILQEEVCGANGEKLDVEEVIAQAEIEGYMCAKHILLTTVDDENLPISDEAKAEKLAQAESLLAQLQAITDPAELEAKMDELIAEYGEDPGAEFYTDGYTFKSGEMVEEFENAVVGMEPYGLSEIVETSYGYHIIMRLPLSAAAAVEYYSEDGFYSLAYLIAPTIFQTVMNSWVEESVAVFSKEYGEMDVGELFNKAVEVPAGG